MHLFLSPHLDDAALSCGASIHRLTRQGKAVTILTVTAGDPATSEVDSPKIQDLHQRWGVGDSPVAVRRREDEQAARALAARVIHLSVGDCIYRTVRLGGDVTALYPSEESLFGEVHPDDSALSELLATPLPQAEVIYAPLGVGHHVDHQITRDWALGLKQRLPAITLKFYEEYPYVNDKMAVERALAFFGPGTMQVERVQVDEEDIEAKVNAIACYQSQISTFWHSLQAMAEATRQVMLEAGGGVPVERFWLSVS